MNTNYTRHLENLNYADSTEFIIFLQNVSSIVYGKLVYNIFFIRHVVFMSQNILSMILLMRVTIKLCFDYDFSYNIVIILI